MNVTHREYGDEVWTHSIHLARGNMSITEDEGQAQYKEYVDLENTWKVSYLYLAVF